jgi:hypothetical protein
MWNGQRVAGTLTENLLSLCEPPLTGAEGSSTSVSAAGAVASTIISQTDPFSVVVQLSTIRVMYV